MRHNCSPHDDSDIFFKANYKTFFSRPEDQELINFFRQNQDQNIFFHDQDIFFRDENQDQELVVQVNTIIKF